MHDEDYRKMTKNRNFWNYQLIAYIQDVYNSWKLWKSTEIL